MKKYLVLPHLTLSLLVAAVFSLVLNVNGAPAGKNSTKPVAGTASTNSEPEIPLSVFVMPAEPKDGKDPFFPNSLRPYARKQTQTTKAAPRSEEHTSELQSPYVISYAVFCF